MSGKHISDERYDMLYVVQTGRCAFCWGRLGRFGTVEHVIPQRLFALGERKSAHNVVLAHPTCNNKKGGALPGDFDYMTLSAFNIIADWTYPNASRLSMTDRS